MVLAEGGGEDCPHPVASANTHITVWVQRLFCLRQVPAKRGGYVLICLRRSLARALLRRVSMVCQGSVAVIAR